MSQSSIGASVKAANSKLAQFLRRREEEEMILQIGKRKPKEIQEKRQPGGRARWSLPADFSVPTPMVDRPRTISGATSFHFSYISVSKEAVPTVGGKPIAGPHGKVRQAALDHSKYIERDGAAEVSSGAHHAAYLERPGAVEGQGFAPHANELMGRAVSDTIGEELTTDEAALLGPQVAAREGVPSIFSNISDDPFERQEYWRAVERSERNPKTHQIILDPETSPRWWNALANSERLDPAFKNHILLVAEKYKQYLATPAPREGSKKPFKADPYPVSSERAGKLIQQAMAIPGFDHSMPPLRFKSGRGGRVQIRFVAELPHEISPKDRALIVQNFCDKLSSLEERVNPDGTTEKVGMMYTAVIHAPDAHNDSRNYHLHIVAHDRPARFLEEQAMWDFEFQEHFIIKRMERIRYPFRQNKIGEIARPGDGAEYSRAGRNFVPAMRGEFAKITNAVLKARGIARHYDPRSYEAMGIDRTPTEHLGTKAAALEAIGVPTVVGQLNAIAIWNDAERAIERHAKQSDKALKARQNEIETLTKKLAVFDPKHPTLITLRQLIAQRSEMIENLADDRRAIMTFDHMEAKAKSRAIRTRQTCLQFLADIENGKADGSTRIMKSVITARWKDAQNHIETIDAQLQPHRDELARIAADIERREGLVETIDKSYLVLEAEVLSLLATQPIKRAQAKASPTPNPKTPPPTKTVSTSPVAETTPTPMPATPPVPVPTKTIPEATRTGSDLNLKSKAETAQHLAADEARTEARSSEPTSGKQKANDAPQAALERQSEPNGRGKMGKITEGAQKPQSVATPPQKKHSVAAPLRPVTIDGLPIVKPTIAPTPSSKEDLGTNHPTDIPEGLNPLRPESPMKAGKPEPVIVIPDISGEAQLAAEKQLQSPTVPANPIIEGLASTNPSPPLERASSLQTEQIASPPIDKADVKPEPKPDLFQALEEPRALPPVEEPSPTAADLSATQYERWEDLIDKIVANRIPVMVENIDGSEERFHVPALDEDEKKLLSTPRLAKRTSGRLKGIYERQQLEIKRLATWVTDYANDNSLFQIEDRKASMGVKAPQAVKTLWRKWGRHPLVVEAVRNQNLRRLKIEKNKIIQRVEENARIVYGHRQSRERLLADAAEKYPAPDQVYTWQVSEFTRLLRELAPKEKLQAAADQINANIDAREDINRHTVHLATAYSQFVETRDLWIAHRQRNDRNGHG